jgi:hypothetical protein
MVHVSQAQSVPSVDRRILKKMNNYCSYSVVGMVAILLQAQSYGQLQYGYVTTDKESGEIVEIIYKGTAEWLEKQEDRHSHFYKLPQLKRLTLVGHVISQDEMKCVAALRELKALDIGSASWGLAEDDVTIDGQSLSQIRNMSWLEELEVKASGLTDEDWEFLPKCKSLKSLMIDGDITVSDQFLQYVTETKSLERLEVLCNSDFSNNAFASLATLRKLETLRVYSCPRLSDSGAQTVGQLTQLEKLHLAGKMKVTTKVIEHIGGLRKLRDLSLDIPQVSKSAMETLAAFKQLQSLSISSARIGDDDIALFKNHPSLKRLYFSGAQVSPNSVGHLATIGHLEYVSLGGDDRSKRVAELVNRQIGLRTTAPRTTAD